MSMYSADMGTMSQFCGEEPYGALVFIASEQPEVDFNDPDEREVMNLAMENDMYQRNAVLEEENARLRALLAQREHTS